MYEEYMKNFFEFPYGGYKNTYDQYTQNYYGMNYEPRYEYDMVQNYPYSYQTREKNQAQNLEKYYPEIYKIVYPMVRKVCMKNNRYYEKDVIDEMVEEVYKNIQESEDAFELNITLNNDVRGENKEKSAKEDRGGNEIEEKRQARRNNGLNDLIRILILRELMGRPGCMGPNCRPGFGPGFGPGGGPNFGPGSGPRPPIPPRPPRPRDSQEQFYGRYE